MRFLRLLLTIGATLFLLMGVEAKISYHQERPKTYSEDYYIKMWNKSLKKFKLPPNAVELVKINSFPSLEQVNSNIYLADSRYMTHDQDLNIYVTDNRLCQVLKFNASGKLLFRFGRKGQGPGEFLNPWGIMLAGQYIVVNDIQNMMVKYFDESGEYIKGFKIFKSYWEMAMNQEGLIFAAPIRLTPQAPMIDILTSDGKLLSSFGEPLEYKGRHGHALNRVGLAINPKGELLLAFKHLPIVRRYSPQGILLGEYRLDHEKMKFEEKLTLDRVNSSANNIGYVLIIRKVQGKDDGFYILHHNPRIEILEYDHNGRMIADYWNIGTYNYEAKDFFVRNIGNEKIFYLLQSGPENIIDVFRRKNKKEVR